MLFKEDDHYIQVHTSKLKNKPFLANIYGSDYKLYRH